MQKAIYPIVFLFLSCSVLKAQSAEEAAVGEVINRLFMAMNKADSVMLKSVFAADAGLTSVVKNKEGNTILSRESIMEFTSIVGKQTTGALTEEIWNLKIQIDGDFAQAWCDYGFYFNNKFSHCGVDAFQLYRSKEGWKIFQLADTRRREGCIIPEAIQQKHQ